VPTADHPALLAGTAASNRSPYRDISGGLAAGTSHMAEITKRDPLEQLIGIVGIAQAAISFPRLYPASKARLVRALVVSGAEKLRVVAARK
jgi:hypothetical protein